MILFTLVPALAFLLAGWVFRVKERPRIDPGAMDAQIERELREAAWRASRKEPRA